MPNRLLLFLVPVAIMVALLSVTTISREQAIASPTPAGSGCLEVVGFYGAINDSGTFVRTVEKLPVNEGDYINVTGTTYYDGRWAVLQLFRYQDPRDTQPLWGHRIEKKWQGVPPGFDVDGGVPTDNQARVCTDDDISQPTATPVPTAVPTPTPTPKPYSPLPTPTLKPYSPLPTPTPTVGPTPTTSELAPKVSVQELYSELHSELPLSFEANRGQTDDKVKFLSRGSGYTLFLTPKEAVLVLSNSGALFVFRMELPTIHKPRVSGLNPLPWKSNYLIGQRNGWHTGIPHYAKVKYENVYPSVDLVYYGAQELLEFDFVVAPGGDPGDIRLSFKNLDSFTIDTQGNLILNSSDKEIILTDPAIYQDDNGVRQEIAGGYVRKSSAHVVGIEVEAYDAARPLTIHQTIHLGGSDDDVGNDMAVGADGSVYIVGETRRPDFPTDVSVVGCLPTICPTDRVAVEVKTFVTKWSPSVGTLVYTTYLGGSGEDKGRGIAVDAPGSSYVTGETSSPDFPIATILGGYAIQANFGGGSSDAFVAQLNPAGDTLVYSTFLGGRGADSGHGIAVDHEGFAYVTGGWSRGRNFDVSAVFVMKLAPQGSARFYSIWPGLGAGNHVALDTEGNAYIVATGNVYAINGDGEVFVPLLGFAADLALTGTGPPGPVIAGTALTYEYIVTNNGPSNARSVVLTATLSAEVTLVLATPSQGDCRESGAVLECKLGGLVKDGTIVVAIKVGINPQTEGTITIAASVKGNEADFNMADNVATESFAVTPPPTPTPTSTPTPTPTPTPTATPSPAGTPTLTPAPTPTPTPTPEPTSTPVPTSISNPTATLTAAPTPTATPTPTAEPTRPQIVPQAAPTSRPTATGTSVRPTEPPSPTVVAPTTEPVAIPTPQPTPTPAATGGGGCSAPADEMGAVDGAWMLFGLLGLGVVLARRKG